ncbi:helix-turn-helix transcriptional regulator [Piscinibacter sakaiensis]|uniref:helix-turn-helix transcriptional regulator n=1 Tax=Piscinibacter sakaiensis TaxID=1547922 RepID=UPI0018D16EBA|nr:AraC family transcriptional regulator [Piscinibacter sakaiensis]
MSVSLNPGEVPELFDIETRSVDESREYVRSFVGHSRVNPVRERLALRYAVTSLGGLHAVKACSPDGAEFVHEDSGFAGLSVTLPIQGSLLIEAGGQVVEAGPADGAVVDVGGRRRSVYGGGLEMAYIVFEAALLREALAARLGREVTRFAFAPRFDRGLPNARLLTQLALAMVDGVRGEAPLLCAPIATHHLRQAMIDALVDGLPHDHAPLIRFAGTPGLLARPLRRAVEFMQAHAGTVLGLKDLAAAASTSPRSLQLAFQQAYGMTPMGYLRELRLQRVREDLLDPLQTGSVGSVARRWGFVHLGNFAGRYARRFGERPGETRRRGGRTPPGR